MISALGDWLQLLLLAGFVGGGLSFLIPENQGRIKDYVRLSVSLLLLLILLTPILKALTGKTDLSFTYDSPSLPSPDENLYNTAIEKEADRLLKERIASIVKNKFPNAQFEIEPVYDKENEEVTLKCIKINTASPHADEIASYLRSLLETEVILNE